MAVIINGSEIVLSGMVGGTAAGDGFWEPDGFSSSDVINALATVGRDSPVTLRLNSGGGIATEGAAIHAALMQHKGAVQIIVEGIAASAASVVAMAADTLVMSPGSVLMIHEPAGLTFGDAAAHQMTINSLNALGDAYAGVYADRTGKSADEMRAVMKVETWMTAEQAVEQGFADAITTANDNEPQEEPMPAPFAYAVYARAPQKLVAMANANGWRPRMSMAPPARADAAKVASMPEIEPVENLPEAVPAEAAAEAAPEMVEVAAEPVTPAASDPAAELAAIAAECGAAGMTAAQITGFITSGGTLERAQSRAAELFEIRDDIARARRCNSAVALTAEQAIARGLSVEQVRAELAPQIAAQVEIAPQTPGDVDPEPAEKLMMLAVARINERNKRASRR